MAKFNDAVIDETSEPMSYDKITKEFTIESDDTTLILQILPYSVEAEFVEYPKVDNPDVSTAKAEADVEFDNPCWYPFTFESTAQTSPGSNEYTG